MESTPEFASFKKVIIFGSKDSGKTSLSKRIERGSFSNESPTDNAFVTSKISIDYEQNKTLNLNIYEIRLDDDFVKNNALIESFLFECQCALFLVDITNPDSFNLIKELINNANISKFSYLKSILVQNKFDLESTRQVSSFEIKEYLDTNKSIDSLEISIKNGDNIQELIKKINEAVNENKNELPSNIVSEAVEKKANLMNAQGSLSFILIGDSTVEKTCFLNRYFKNQFTETFLSTIGIDKEMKHVKVGNENYKLTVWDTAGQERFRCLPKKYYQNADGVLLLFDVTLEETFTSVSNWMKDVKDNSNKNISNDANNQSDISLYLIGNKIDKPDRVVSRERAEEMARSLGMKYFEVSCKLNMNIPEVMARMIMECHMKANNITNCFKLEKPTNNNQAKGKKSCCK
jgi:small GTP-binding protein